MSSNMVFPEDRCPDYDQGHVYKYESGRHRCTCGASMVFDDVDRTWSKK